MTEREARMIPSGQNTSTFPRFQRGGAVLVAGALFAPVVLAVSASGALSQAAAVPPEFITATMPIYGQIVRFPAPVRYAPAFSKNNENKFFIFEMIPKGETVEKWTGMITLTGQNGSAAPLPALRDHIGNFFNRFQNACPKTFAAKPISDAQINGHVAVLVYFSCAQLQKPAYGPQGHSESVVIAFIQGAKDLYTVQWAERGAAQNAPIPFDDSKWRNKLDVLRAVRLCTRVPGEAAPFPSCLAVK